MICHITPLYSTQVPRTSMYFGRGKIVSTICVSSPTSITQVHENALWNHTFYGRRCVCTEGLCIFQRLCIFGLYGSIQMLLLLLLFFFGPTSTKPQAEILKLNISYYISLGVLSFFSSNAVLGGHHTEHNQTLPHVLKWARFENSRPKFWGSPLKRVAQKLPIFG